MNAPHLTRPRRPIGVAILTILQIIIGIGDVILGTVLLSAALTAGVLVGGILATALFLVDCVAIGLGMFSLAVAYGLWTRKRWAWRLGVIGAIIGIILGAVVVSIRLVGGSGIFESLSSSPREPLVPIVIYAIILACLSTRNVRTFFSR